MREVRSAGFFGEKSNLRFPTEAEPWVFGMSEEEKSPEIRAFDPLEGTHQRAFEVLQGSSWQTKIQRFRLRLAATYL